MKKIKSEKLSNLCRAKEFISIEASIKPRTLVNRTGQNRDLRIQTLLSPELSAQLSGPLNKQFIKQINEVNEITALIRNIYTVRYNA